MANKIPHVPLHLVVLAMVCEKLTSLVSRLHSTQFIVRVASLNFFKHLQCTEQLKPPAHFTSHRQAQKHLEHNPQL